MTKRGFHRTGEGLWRAVAFPSLCGNPVAARLPSLRDFAERRAAVIVVLLSLLLTACASPPLPEESEPVVALMSGRLALARDIAWAKWSGGLPVRDSVREAEVVEKLARQGAAAGIDELLVGRFVRAQIEASCLEQEAWMQKWRKGTPLPVGEPPSLDSLRKQTDRLSSLLLAEWAAAPTTPRAAARQRLLKSVTNPRAATVAASGFLNAAL